MKSNAQEKSVLLPLILLIPLCLILAAIFGYIAYLHTVNTPSEQLPRTVFEPAVTEAPTERATASPVPGPTVTPIPAAEATAEPEWQFTGNSEHFWAEGAVRRSESFRSPDLSVSVQTVVDTETFHRRVTYYIADIFVRDITQIKTASCRGDFNRGGAGSVSRTAKNVNALVAVSGDYCGCHRDSLVIRNGTVYRKSVRTDMDVCLLLKDGTMETIRGGTVTLKEILEKDIWQAWQFGPALLTDDGEARTSFPNSNVGGRNPRCCIGYADPGHYMFVVVDGRQKQSRGVTLRELASLMESLGCRTAFNLDGGASAHFFWHDRVYSNPSGGGRSISDIIYIEKEDYPDSDYLHGKGGNRK